MSRFPWRTLGQLSPAMLIMLVFVIVPVAFFAVYSFWKVKDYNIVREWNVDNYREALSQGVYRSLYVNTIRIAATTATLTVIIAYGFTHVMRFHLRRWQESLLFLVIIALFSGYLVRIFAWRTILGDRGIVNTILEKLGLIDEPLTFLLYNRTAAVIVLTNFLVPLAVLPIYAALQNVRDSDVEAARDLGCGAFGAFRRVTLPLVWGGVVAAWALTFIVAAGDYLTPQLVGGVNGTMIGQTIADSFLARFSWPSGAALSFVTLVVTLVCVGIVRGVGRRVIR